MPLIFLQKKCRIRLDITHYSELYFKHQQKTNERHERKARMFLATKYGEELASEIIEEVEK